MPYLILLSDLQFATTPGLPSIKVMARVTYVVIFDTY